MVKLINVTLACCTLLTLLAFASPTNAGEKADNGAKQEAIAVHHAPVSAAPAGETLQLSMGLSGADQIKRAVLVYRTEADNSYREVEFRRAGVQGSTRTSGAGPYLAIIDGAFVKAPALEYTIEIEPLNAAERQTVFSSRAEPHRIQVLDDGMDLIEQALDERLDGRRSVFSTSAEYVSFGKSMALVDEGAGLVEREVRDSYYRIEGGYSYRLLRTVHAFSVRIGAVRGTAPVAVRELTPGQTPEQRFDVGLNYGATSVTFRMGESWYFDGSFLANVTEVGFSVKTGANLHIGDPYGSKLTLGFEAIETFGSRFYTQVDIEAHQRLILSPIVEVTNMPSADDYGLRLLGELRANLGAGFGLSARGGYQARDAASGGPSGGGMFSYGF